MRIVPGAVDRRVVRVPVRMFTDHVQAVQLVEDVHGAVVTLGCAGEVLASKEGGGSEGAGVGVEVHGYYLFFG